LADFVGFFGASVQRSLALGFRDTGARHRAKARLILVQISIQAQSEPARIPTCRGSFLRVKESTMLGMALLIGFAFVCLVIAHDRLINRL